MSLAATTTAIINQMPEEIIWEILDRLPSLRDIIAASQVCLKWHRISKDESLSRSLASKKFTIQCNKPSEHDWFGILKIFEMKDRKTLALQYQEHIEKNECLRKNFARPDNAFRLIRALFPGYRPQQINSPHIEIKDRCFLNFPTTLGLMNTINFRVDQFRRKFIFLNIKQKERTNGKFISLQQLDSKKGDWYLFSQSRIDGITFVEPLHTRDFCGRIIGDGKIIDVIIFNYIQTLIDKGELTLSHTYGDTTYQLTKIK